jgi:hypothetical protein
MPEEIAAESGERVVKNPCLDVALAELETAGVRDVTVAKTGGGHYQLRWQVRPHDHRIITLSSTPSDTNAPNQVRREVRKALRVDGMLEERPVKAPPQRQPSRLEVLTQRVAALEQVVTELRGRLASMGKPQNGGRS